MIPSYRTPLDHDPAECERTVLSIVMLGVTPDMLVEEQVQVRRFPIGRNVDFPVLWIRGGGVEVELGGAEIFGSLVSEGRGGIAPGCEAVQPAGAGGVCMVFSHVDPGCFAADDGGCGCGEEGGGDEEEYGS